MIDVIVQVITAPGRLAAWLQWAMPTSRYFHDDEVLAERFWHWVYSIAFYLGVYGAVEAGLLDILVTNLGRAFASR